MLGVLEACLVVAGVVLQINDAAAGGTARIDIPGTVDTVVGSAGCIAGCSCIISNIHVHAVRRKVVDACSSIVGSASSTLALGESKVAIVGFSYHVPCGAVGSYVLVLIVACNGTGATYIQVVAIEHNLAGHKVKVI